MPRLPFALDCAAVALFFYAAGHWLSAGIASTVARLSRPRAFALGCVLAAIYVVAALANGRVDMQRLQFGASSGMYFLVALLGVCALLLLCASLPSGRLTRWLSLNTLYIFPSHALALAIMTGALYFGLRLSVEQIHTSAIAAVASVIFALIFAVPFVPRTRAWLISRRPRET